MKPAIYATPEEAQSVFYQSLNETDIEKMMTVWSGEEDVACIHPSGLKLVGFNAIHEGFRTLFAESRRFAIQPISETHWGSAAVSVHTVVEMVNFVDTPNEYAQICATNVFVRSANGWKLILHHCTPLVRQEGADEQPRILH